MNGNIPENHYNIIKLEDVVEYLREDQIIKIKRVKEWPEDFSKYPYYPYEKEVSNGSRGWYFDVSGIYEVVVLRG